MKEEFWIPFAEAMLNAKLPSHVRTEDLEIKYPSPNTPVEMPLELRQMGRVVLSAEELDALRTASRHLLETLKEGQRHWMLGSLGIANGDAELLIASAWLGKTPVVTAENLSEHLPKLCSWIFEVVTKRDVERMRHLAKMLDIVRRAEDKGKDGMDALKATSPSRLGLKKGSKRGRPSAAEMVVGASYLFAKAALDEVGRSVIDQCKPRRAIIYARWMTQRKKAGRAIGKDEKGRNHADTVSTSESEFSQCLQAFGLQGLLDDSPVRAARRQKTGLGLTARKS